MKKMHKLQNANKLTLNKLKIAKLDNLTKVKGGVMAIIDQDDDESDDDTWRTSSYVSC